MKGKEGFAYLARSAALAALAAVILVSLRAGVDLLAAVLRGMMASLAVHWLLSGLAELLSSAAFRAEPKSDQGEEPESFPPSRGGKAVG